MLYYLIVEVKLELNREGLNQPTEKPPWYIYYRTGFTICPINKTVSVEFSLIT